jgi:GNAT superfamily N-acetyltransferase
VEPYFDCLDIDAFTNAPWNVLKDQPETIKGAATSLMEELVEESKELGFGGRISLIAIERAIVFYTRIGFTQEDDSRSLELIPTAAARFLQRQRNRRRTLNQ